MWSPPFPASLPPHHLRRALPDASISAGLNPSSSLMDLRSRRRPASFALFVTTIADDALRKKLHFARYIPHHLGLPSSSSSMPLCSKRRPASFALFVTFIADDALRKNLSRPIIFLIILVSLGVVAHQGLYLTLLEAQDAAEVAVLSSYILL